MNEDNFLYWLRHQKYTVVLSLLCAIIPFIPSINNWGFLNLDKEFVTDAMMNLANVFFILVTLVMLVSSNFLIGKNVDEKEKKLCYYIRKSLGENCRLLHDGKGVFFRRMEVSIKQFYYSWIIVWCIWLLMYVLKIFMLLFVNPDFIKVGYFIENALNLLNSFAMCFIYMVITFYTVGVSSEDGDCKQMHIGVILFVIVGALCMGADFCCLFFESSKYDELQFFIRLIIGMIASISMMMVLGRLNSSYLDIPQWLILSLYIYAAIQMMYPLLYLLDAEVVSSNSIFIKERKIIRVAFYLMALGGKVALFMVVLWIIRRKRFLFFLVHKAHSLAESDDMLETFNRIYDGYVEKKEYL